MSNYRGPFAICDEEAEITQLQWDIAFPSGVIQIPVKRYNARLQRKGGRFTKLGHSPVTKRDAMRLALRHRYRGF